MSQEVLVERLFETLIAGDRQAARALVQETISQGVSAETILADLFWPAHETIEKLHKSDQMTAVTYQMATRLLRMLVDQQAARLKVPTIRERTVFAACGPSQGEELAGQMAVDMLEANGFDVTFTGGGIPADEIMAEVQARRPDILLLFASAASDLPGIRRIINNLRENGACANTRILVGGGVFNRADGLAEEMGADLWAYSPSDVVDLLINDPVGRGEELREVASPARKRKTRAA
ncbi:MAG TPA: cobalamin-dependent protein [Phycisphaerales bacterium]|nr:cobalamin-dependent protein [Phycisphaerales bacterium]